MGGRGGSSGVTRERMLQDFNALIREQGQLGPEQQIQRAIQQLRRDPGSFVHLADVREQTNLSREVFDRTIRQMSIGPNRVLHTIPEENQQTLTERRRRGGVNIGGEVNHLVRIGQMI